MSVFALFARLLVVEQHASVLWSSLQLPANQQATRLIARLKFVLYSVALPKGRQSTEVITRRLVYSFDTMAGALAKQRLQALSQQLVEGIPDEGTFEGIPRIRHVAGDSAGQRVKDKVVIVTGKRQS